jgi:hypothetical protein
MRCLIHPAFRDVYMAVRKSFFVPEKNIWKLRVIWMHRRHGYVLGEEKLIVTADKYREFRIYGGE